MLFFYVPAEYQQNDAEENMEYENSGKKALSGRDPYDFRVASTEQLATKESQDVMNASPHVACKPPRVHSDPRICQFFNFQKSAKGMHFCSRNAK